MKAVLSCVVVLLTAIIHAVAGSWVDQVLKEVAGATNNCDALLISAPELISITFKVHRSVIKLN